MSKLSTRRFSAEIQLNPSSLEKGTPSAARQQAGHNTASGPFAGQAEILAAIADLRQELFRNAAIPEARAAQKDAPPALVEELRKAHSRDLEDAARLRVEMEKLSTAIDTTKREIASMRFQSVRKGERLTDVTHELDEVVLDTERATNGILTACEEIEKHAQAITLQASSPDEREEIEALSEKVIQIYEACNFQDITGQRISKVVNTLKFIEERLDVMMGIWGGNAAFAAIELPEITSGHDDDLLLNGPARSDGDSVNQSDIDALFD
jgi:chemotaxis protein CheZ